MSPAPTSRRFELKKLLDEYTATSAETRYRAEMVDLARSPDDVLSAYWYSPGHFTASAFVVDAPRERLLLVHHRELDVWLQPGGHIEPGDATMLSAAEREVVEETGVQGLVAVEDRLFDIDVHRIPAHGGTPPHFHHDLRFLFSTSHDALAHAEEVKDARWVPLAELPAYTPDQSVRRAARKIISAG